MNTGPDASRVKRKEGGGGICRKGLTFKSWLADALKGTVTVAAFRVVVTRVRRTFVDVLLATLARRSRRALALEATDQVGAGRTVHARIRRTLVHLGLTVPPSVAGPTTTLVAIVAINAGAMATAHAQAFVDVEFAIRSVETFRGRGKHGD